MSGVHGCGEHESSGVNVSCMVRTYSANCEVSHHADLRVWQNSEFSANDYENLVELYLPEILHGW